MERNESRVLEPGASRSTLRAAGALAAGELRELCLRCGADDAGFVSLADPLVASERESIAAAFPGAKALVSIAVRMQQENVRSPKRSLANQAFHASGHEVDETCRRIVLALQDSGVRACNPSMGFPMELGSIGEERSWVVSHKVVAQASGLGRMGIHRSVIHPRFGSFVLLGTVLIDREIDGYTAPLDFDPCISCKLCVATCPVGALSADGNFNAASCMTHNYREFLGGFTDWVEQLVSSTDVASYRAKVEDGETLSMWQSLAYGPNYKAAYCLAVCPAGEDVLPGFAQERAEHLKRVVRPLQEKREPLYVVAGSDAEAFAARRYPHKRLRRVHSGIRATSVRSFLRALPWMFQRGQSAGLDATYHFAFRGEEPIEATVVIRDQGIDIRPGLEGSPDVRIEADSSSWVRFVRREKPLWRLLVTGALRTRPRLRGARLLAAFDRCFPA